MNNFGRFREVGFWNGHEDPYSNYQSKSSNTQPSGFTGLGFSGISNQLTDPYSNFTSIKKKSSAAARKAPRKCEETCQTTTETKKPAKVWNRSLGKAEPFFDTRGPFFGTTEPLFGAAQTLFGTTQPLFEPPELLFGTDKPLHGSADTAHLSGTNSKQIGFGFKEAEEKISKCDKTPKQIGFTLGFMCGAGPSFEGAEHPPISSCHLQKSSAKKRTMSGGQISSSTATCPKNHKTNKAEQSEQIEMEFKDDSKVDASLTENKSQDQIGSL